MRIIPFKRLNMYHKHRVSMLYNMASNLIIHERIKTTYGKAKSLAFLINRVFRIGRNIDILAKRNIRSILRIPTAYNKFFNGLLEKYRYDDFKI